MFIITKAKKSFDCNQRVMIVAREILGSVHVEKRVKVHRVHEPV